jgi:HEAT repeat protein
VALVPRLSPARDIQVSLEFATWLRGQIDLTRVDWTRAVFNALGALDEGAAIPDLLDSLSSQERPLREAAQAALQRHTRHSLGPDPTRRDAWYQSESSWYDRGRLAQDVGSRRVPSQDLIASLRAYSQHRLFKSDLAADLLPLLDNPDPAVRALVCETLEHLGSQRAVRDLIPLLDDPAPNVATAARHALEALVGGNVPRESAAARESILHES